MYSKCIYTAFFADKIKEVSLMKIPISTLYTYFINIYNHFKMYI